MTALLADGDHFALIAMETRSEVSLAPIEVVPSLWISNSPIIEMDSFWRDTLGSHQLEQFQSCTLFGLIKGSLFDLDAHLSQAWAAFLLAERIGTEEEPFRVIGNVSGSVINIRAVGRLHPSCHVAADKYRRLQNRDISRIAYIGGRLRTYPSIGAVRFNRVLSLYVETRSRLDWMDRIHQYTRCLDGLTVPPGGGTAPKFAERMGLIVGSLNAAFFEDLYKIRGAVEHLRENDHIEPFDRAGRLELIRKAGIAEFVVRSSLVRILETPNLQPFFRSKADLEKFWALPLPDRQQLWGPPIDPMLGIAGFDDSQWSDKELGGP